MSEFLTNQVFDECIYTTLSNKESCAVSVLSVGPYILIPVVFFYKKIDIAGLHDFQYQLYKHLRYWHNTCVQI